MAITLQFVAGDGIGAELIEWFSAGDFSHVDIVMPDGSLLGARLDGGVRIRSANYQTFHKRAVAVLDRGQSVSDAFIAAAVSQIGKPYDKTAIIGFAAGRDWREDDSWFCSELAAWALEQANTFPHAFYAPASKITPNGLLLAISTGAHVTVS